MKTTLIGMAAMLGAIPLLAAGCDDDHKHRHRVIVHEQRPVVVERHAVVVERPAPVVERHVIVEPSPSVVIVKTAPPPLIVERRPAPPSRTHVWVSGYYNWDSHRSRHVWVSGRYAVPPRKGAVWVDHKWEPVRGGWKHSPGHWR